MSGHSEAGRAVITWLRELSEERMISTFDEHIVTRFPLEQLKSFEDQGQKHKHSISHELVKKGKIQVLQHLVERHGFNLNVQRPTDLCTPLHLALWQKKDEVAQQLLALAADANIANMYGEDASAIRAVHKPIGAQLQGATQPQEILNIVDASLSSFQPLDRISAYFGLARLAADYDGEFCTRSSRNTQMCQMPVFRKLAEACVEILCGPGSDDSAKLWATMLRAWAMLPDQFVLDSLALWLENNCLPLSEADGQTIADIAWGIAKLEGGHDRPSRLWDLCYESLGEHLSNHIRQMDQKHLASSLWSFAKVGSKDRDNIMRHPQLFQSVAVT